MDKFLPSQFKIELHGAWTRMCIGNPVPARPEPRAAAHAQGKNQIPKIFRFHRFKLSFFQNPNCTEGMEAEQKRGGKNIAHPTKEPSPGPITQMPRAGGRAASERAVAARPLERTRGMRIRGECIQIWRGVYSKRGV